MKMASEFVKFEVPADLANKVLEAVTIAKATGKTRKGVNETTKAIERGIAKLVVMALDVTPPEVLMHIPVLCEEKQVPYAYVPNKIELGKACGIDVPTSSIAVTDEGEAKKLITDVAAKLNELKKK
ncbi:MAG: 50S ribosomal protein L7Ae [Candidatus Aenigmarchaeota archaeon]